MKTVVVQRRRSGKTDINWMAEGGGDETYFSLQVVVFLSKYLQEHRLLSDQRLFIYPLRSPTMFALLARVFQ